MRPMISQRARRRARYLPLALAPGLMLLASCIQQPPRVLGAASTAPSQDVPWTPPPKVEARVKAKTPAVPSATIPPDILQRAASLTLADLVDLALRNSPQTAAAWADARSAAADYGSKRGEYYPTVDIGANVGRAQGSFANGAIGYYQRSYGPTADLNWLLYDFGGREASVEETREALFAADWTHNAVIQNVILQVQQAYYQYVTSKALLEAQRASYKEAQTSLASAEERHKAGVATIADVLQAKTAVSQAKLAVESLEGQIQTTRGALATAVGLPANTPYDVSFSRENVHIEPTNDAVEKFLSDAEAMRPDLAAARADAAKAAAHVKTIKAEGYPSLVAAGTAGRVFYDHANVFGDTYTAQILLKFPLFTGFSHQYDVQKAKADRDSAVATLQNTEQLVALQVWSSYYALKTAEQRVATSEELLKSAAESYDVASGRYKAGVGGILDLLSAQAALEGARAQRIQAYSDWYMALAQLAHDAGTLTPTNEQLKMKTPVTVEKDGTP